MKDISLLLPKVQDMTRDFITQCKSQGIDVIITSTYRDKQEQDKLYAQGRTTSGNVVTNAQFGDSMHNYKVAIDFAPINKDGVIAWNDKALFTRIGQIGESCGFEWGGRWTSFLDLPHLQYTAGYSLSDFKNKLVDCTRFQRAEIDHSTTVNVKADTPFISLQKAILAFQLSEGITSFAGETDLRKIVIGPATQKAINKYKI